MSHVAVHFTFQNSWTIAFLTGKPGGDVLNHLEGDYVSELADAPPRQVSTDDLWLDSVRGVSLRLYTGNRAITLASGSDTVTVKFGWDDFGWEEEEEETPVE